MYVNNLPLICVVFDGSVVSLEAVSLDKRAELNRSRKRSKPSISFYNDEPSASATLLSSPTSSSCRELAKYPIRLVIQSLRIGGGTHYVRSPEA